MRVSTFVMYFMFHIYTLYIILQKHLVDLHKWEAAELSNVIKITISELPKRRTKRIRRIRDTRYRV